MNLKPLDGVPKPGDRVFWESKEPGSPNSGWYTVESSSLYENAVVLTNGPSGQPEAAYCHELYVPIESVMETKYVAIAMMYAGGGFVSKLGWALMHADLDNSRRIIEAFPEYIKEYTELARSMRIDEEASYYKTYDAAMKHLFGKR